FSSFTSFFLSLSAHSSCFFFFFFTDTAPTEIYTLSLHDALPICQPRILNSLCPYPLAGIAARTCRGRGQKFHHRLNSSAPRLQRSEEHTSELQSPCNLVCRLLLEKKKKKKKKKKK